MDDNIVNVTFLVKFPNKSLPLIVESSPKTFQFKDEDEIMFLSSVDPKNKIEDGSFYSFNIRNQLFYALYFILNDESYSIVVSSEYPFGHLFENFFQIIFDEFRKDSSSCNTAYGRYLYVLSIIKSIPQKVNNSLIITFPFGEIEFKITPASFTYKNYDPTIYFDSNQIEIIWESLITGEPILFVVNDIVMAKNIVFSSLSLVSPLQYLDDFCIWLTETDPRFISIINEKSSLKVVATTSKYLAEATKYFKSVIFVSDKKKYPNKEVRKGIFEKTRKMVILINYYLNNMIRSKDPYFDLLNQEISEEDFNSLLSYYKNQNIPKQEVIMKWIKTNTFKNWRKNRNTKEIFRDGVLGFDYKKLFSWRSESDLKLLNQIISSQISKYSNDPHIYYALKLQKQEIERMLNK